MGLGCKGAPFGTPIVHTGKIPVCTIGIVPVSQTLVFLGFKRGYRRDYKRDYKIDYIKQKHLKNQTMASGDESAGNDSPRY